MFKEVSDKLTSVLPLLETPKTQSVRWTTGVCVEVGSGWNGLRVPDGNLPQGAARTEEAAEEGEAEGAGTTTPEEVEEEETGRYITRFKLNV